MEIIIHKLRMHVTNKLRIMGRRKAELGDTSQEQREQDVHAVQRKDNTACQRENSEYGLP